MLNCKSYSYSPVLSYKLVYKPFCMFALTTCSFLSLRQSLYTKTLGKGHLYLCLAWFLRWLFCIFSVTTSATEMWNIQMKTWSFIMVTVKHCCLESLSSLPLISKSEPSFCCHHSLSYSRRINGYIVFIHCICPVYLWPNHKNVVSKVPPRWKTHFQTATIHCPLVATWV